MLKGINHFTFSVRDLDEAYEFYVENLGFKPVARYEQALYLELKGLWFCFFWQPGRKKSDSFDYTHIAFSVSESQFAQVKQKLEKAGVEIWQDNISEGMSFYFLDPNGHKMEMHVGDLKSRLEYLKKNEKEGLIIY
jgi:catechol 2,3-dioxygenase-like lactoylglutathione lyase family enzyme